MKSKPKMRTRKQRARATAVALLLAKGKRVSMSVPKSELFTLLERFGMAPRGFQGGLGNWYSWWNERQERRGERRGPVLAIAASVPKVFTLDYGERARSLAILGFGSYLLYLQSLKWEKIRRAVLRRDHKLCLLCGGRAGQVHHRTYDLDAMSGRDLRGLASICEDCHREVEFDEYPEKKSTPQQVTLKFNAKRKFHRDKPLVLATQVS